MSADFFARVIGMIFFAIFGWYFGEWINLTEGGASLGLPSSYYALFGAIIGMLISPYISTRPARALRSLLARVTAETLFAGLIGLIAGLMVAALLAFPISLLPPPFGSILPFVGAIFFPYLFISILVTRQNDIMNMLRGMFGRGGGGESATGASWTQPQRTVLLDTSVIIDGRIADVARTGFLPGMLLIPRFVLNELQYIADSADNLRRQRGRRGMEVLAELQKTAHITVRISDIDVEGVREVDDKLVILARQLKCPILTNDYNLNRVAELQGVVILNINELANAVKSVVLPGEVMSLQIIQEGKESLQGVGYMDDGTMVVVENGSRFIGRSASVTVTKVLQTAAGRMIFARPDE